MKKILTILLTVLTVAATLSAAVLASENPPQPASEPVVTTTAKPTPSEPTLTPTPVPTTTVESQKETLVTESTSDETTTPYVVTSEQAIIYAKLNGEMIKTTVFYEKDKIIDIVAFEGDYALSIEGGYVLKSDIVKVVVTKDETGTTQVVAPVTENKSSSGGALILVFGVFVIGLGVGLVSGWFIKGHQDEKSFKKNPDKWHEKMENKTTKNKKQSQAQTVDVFDEPISYTPAPERDEECRDELFAGNNQVTDETIQTTQPPKRRKKVIEIPSSFERAPNDYNGKPVYYDNDDDGTERENEPFLFEDGKKLYFNKKLN